MKRALTASSANRWMRCAAAVQETEAAPEGKDTDAARWGREAHAIGEHLVKGYPSRLFPVGLKPDDLPDEHVEAARLYSQEVGKHANDTEVLVEQYLDLTWLHPAMRRAYADALYRQGDVGHVWDLKTGRVYEDADSWQGKLYCLGAAVRPDFAGVKKWVFHIVQPRAEGEAHRTHEWTLPELADAMLQARRQVRNALGETPIYAPSEESCRFCPALASCPAVETMARNAAALDMLNGKPNGIAALDMKLLEGRLEQADLMECWAKVVKSRAHEYLEHGGVITGWKIVQKRATKHWVDTVEAVRAMDAAGIDEHYHEPTLISPAQAQKKAKDPEKLDAAISYVSSGTTLVRESDKRPAVGKAAQLERLQEARMAQKLLEKVK